MRCGALRWAVHLALCLCFVAEARSAFAQSGNFTQREFDELFTAVETKGISSPLPAGPAATNMGFPIPDGSKLPVRQFDSRSGSERHSVSAIVYKGLRYLVFIRYGDNESWMLKVGHDGKLQISFHLIHRGGAHPLTLAESQPLAAAEESYWMKWLADGAAVPPQ